MEKYKQGTKERFWTGRRQVGTHVSHAKKQDICVLSKTEAKDTIGYLQCRKLLNNKRFKLRHRYQSEYVNPLQPENGPKPMSVSYTHLTLPTIRLV